MKKPSTFFILFLLFVLLIIFIDSIYGVEITSFDYKNEYLEPGKTYDLWVVILPEEEINNTVISIYPYGISKKYIQVLKGEDYEGHLLQGEKGVGHFLIYIRENTPSGDYKIVVYCNYTRDGKRYSDNRVFEIPIRGKPALTLEYPPVIKEGVNKIYIKIKNEGTGTAQDVKIEFEDGNNIYALSEGYIKYIKPGESKLVEIEVYGENIGMAKLPYTLTYSSPYDNLQLVDKKETEGINSKTIVYNYKNQKIIKERGNLVFKIIPNDAINIGVKNYILPLGEVCNFTLFIKNNYRNTNFTVIVGKYYIGNSQKIIPINYGEVKNITFTIKVDEGGVKEIPVKVIFDGNEIERNVSIDVVGEVEIVLTGVNVEGTEEKVITGDISNVGTGRAKGVLISVKETEDVVPLKPYENYFIGTLNPDDYGSFELHAKVTNKTDIIPVVIQYRDENNRLIKIERNISVKKVDIFSYESRGNNSYIPMIIGGLFVLGVLLLLYRIFSKGRLND